MIDRINPHRIAPSAIADAHAPRTVARPAVDGARAAEPAASSLATEPRRLAAEGPPIDAARVDRLRAAIADGSYAIDPERVAAAMIASERG